MSHYTLPRSIAALCPLASVDATRYALGGVLLLVRGDQTFRAEATDGRVLGRVEGAQPVGAAALSPAMLSAPNGKAESLVGAKELKAALKGGRKAPSAVNVVFGEQVTTFGDDTCHTLANVEGRWPKTSEVFPKGAPVVSFDVNPAYLARLLAAAGAFTDEVTPRVRITVYSPTSPVMVETVGAPNGLTFSGLCMPLSKP